MLILGSGVIGELGLSLVGVDWVGICVWVGMDIFCVIVLDVVIVRMVVVVYVLVCLMWNIMMVF